MTDTKVPQYKLIRPNEPDVYFVDLNALGSALQTYMIAEAAERIAEKCDGCSSCCSTNADSRWCADRARRTAQEYWRERMFDNGEHVCVERVVWTPAVHMKGSYRLEMEEDLWSSRDHLCEDSALEQFLKDGKLSL